MAWSKRHRQQTGPAHCHKRQRGVLLLWVALMLAIVAALAYGGNHLAAMAAHDSDAMRDSRVATYLAEAASARMRWAGDHSGCTVPSPISDSLAGSGRYSASAQRNSGSPMTISVRASGSPTDLSGATPTGAGRTLLRPSVYLHKDPAVPPAVLPLFPAQHGDTFISNRNAGQAKHNQSGANVISVDAANSLRALLRFDLSAIPAHATILSTTLTLTRTNASSGASGTVSVHQLRTGWDFDQVTWLTTDGSTPWRQGGGDFDAANLATAASSMVAAGAGNHQWELATAMVDGWVNQPAVQPNLGLILIADASTGTLDFANVNGGGPGATLTVGYQAPCP